MAPELAQLLEETRVLREVNARLEATILKQLQQLEQLIRQVYGKKSEKLDPSQFSWKG